MKLSHGGWERRCPQTGQVMAEYRLGARLTATQAKIYDVVSKAGAEGIEANALCERLDLNLNNIKSQIWHINQAIKDSGYVLRGARNGIGYRLINGQGHGLADRSIEGNRHGKENAPGV
jgi:hypothetical protein